MQYDLGIEHGTVVTAEGSSKANVYVAGGVVAEVGPDRRASADVIDATGLHVLPGMVDTHVHLMDPGEPEREDFPSGTSAAAASGVTTVLEHTHARPVRTADDLAAKRAHLSGRSWVDFGLVAHAWPGMVGEVDELWRQGVAYFKLFTCETHGVAAHDTASLLEHFREYARLGAICLVHCEDDAITADAERRLRATDRDDGPVIAEWRSELAEQVAVVETALLARQTGARVGIAHCSSVTVVELIQRERSEGANLVAEGCPQYFLLREEELHEHGSLRKFTPPARARDDADEGRMWSLLRSGALSLVSSDHAPSTLGHKARGIWDAPFGLPGLDTTMALLVDAAVRGTLTLPEVVRAYSEAPARHYGLWPQKGSLQAGADADVCLVDCATERVLRDDQVLSKAGWTPYAGRRVHGRVVATVLRGSIVACDGGVVGRPCGKFLTGAGAS